MFKKSVIYFILAITVAILSTHGNVFAATVTKDFTATGTGGTVNIHPGESFTYDVSGTFVGTVVLEKTANFVAWDPVVTATSATSGTILSEDRGSASLSYRFRCSAYTSGTIETEMVEIEPAAAGGGSALVSDTAYNATTWDAVTTIAPSKNAVRDKIETLTAPSDAVYGAGWNGVTTIAPSKNAVYDKIETISAGSAPGAVTNLSCADDIQTKITAATAGDTLVLGSCTYDVATTITSAKSIHLVGQSSAKSVINWTGTGGVIMQQTADNFSIKSVGFTGANVGAVLDVDGTSAGGFSGENIKITDIDINVTMPTAGAGISGLRFTNSGGLVRDSRITLLHTDNSTGSPQHRAIYSVQNSACLISTYSYFFNNFLKVTAQSSGALTIVRTVMFYNSTADPSLLMQYHYMAGNTVIARTDAAGTTDALLNQGDTTLYSYGDVFDGGPLTFSNVYVDLQNKDNGSTVYLYGSILASNTVSGSRTAYIFRSGMHIGNGLTLNAWPKPTIWTGASGDNNNSMVVATGGDGGDTSIATTGTGGNGSGITITAGTGGVAASANTASTGGVGGEHTETLGTGGAATGAGINVGGAGGSWALTAGTGGAASGGTSNTGGAGGSWYLKAGPGGTGATAAGADGNINIGCNNTGTCSGKTLIGTTTAPSGVNGVRIGGALELAPSATVLNIVAGTGLTTAHITASSIIKVKGSAAPVTITATPNIAAGVDGQIIHITASHATDTLTLQDYRVLASSGLDLGGENVMLSIGDTITLIYRATDSLWHIMSKGGRIQRRLSNITADVGNVGTGVDNLASYTLRGNVLARVRDTLEVHAYGTTAANGNNKQLKFLLGTTVLYDSGVVAANAAHWDLRCTIARPSSTVAVQESICTMVSNNALIPAASTFTDSTEDTTLDTAIKMTGEATSNNDIVQEGMTVDIVPELAI